MKEDEKMFENPYYVSQPSQQGGLGCYYPRQPQSVSINGRIVTGIEEARAAQIALDGSLWYFPSPAENKIYTKQIGMNGMPVFLTYELNLTHDKEKSVNQNSILLDLVERVKKLEEVTSNGSNANNATVTANE